MNNLRVSLVRSRGYLSPRGFGIWYQYGCLGTSYGDTREDMSLTIYFGLWYVFELRAHWKVGQNTWGQ